MSLASVWEEGGKYAAADALATEDQGWHYY